MDKDKVKGMVLDMVEKTLDLLEISIANADQYKVMRKRILRWGNDIIREIYAKDDSIYKE